MLGLEHEFDILILRIELGATVNEGMRSILANGALRNLRASLELGHNFARPFW